MENIEKRLIYEPKQRQEFNIECENLNHKNELVKYILLKNKTDCGSRLLCRKCIEGKYNQQTNEICLISDVIDNPFNAFKFTNYFGNINQIFCDFIYSYDFTYNEDSIRFKMDEIRQLFLYHLKQLEEKLLEQYNNYKKTQEFLNNLVNKFTQNFDTTKLKESLNEAQNKFGKTTPKDKQKLRKDVNDYVAKFYNQNQSIDSEQYKNLFKSIDETKSSLAQKEKQLRFFKFKLDQGLEKILEEIQKMEQTFSTLHLRQSELSSTYMDELIQKINPIFKDKKNFQDKIKRIYQSRYDGLDSKKVKEKIISLNPQNQMNQQTLLFIFLTSSQQTFGVYVNKNSSQIFHQNKRQEFQIKENVTPLIMNYDNNQPEILMTFGKEDIIIKSSFVGCISNLGQGFNVSPEYQIGDLKSHLANQNYFDIVQVEIFQILQ